MLWPVPVVVLHPRHVCPREYNKGFIVNQPTTTVVSTSTSMTQHPSEIEVQAGSGTVYARVAQIQGRPCDFDQKLRLARKNE